MRTRFQGLSNIVRFNWPYYAAASAAALLLFLLSYYLQGGWRFAAGISLILLAVSTFLSLFVSWYVYDRSDLYDLNWLDQLKTAAGETMISLNAGFDETTPLLKDRFRDAEIIPCDFFDAGRHTEPSIRRARAAYPPYPGTQMVSASALPFEDSSVATVLAILSAHEIRDGDDRVKFFAEARRLLTPGGSVVVVEHLRNAANLLAFNVGAFHFYSRKSWLETFDSAGLAVESERTITPFITAFVLTRNGNSN